MPRLAVGIADLQAVRLDQGRAWQAIPKGHGPVMFRGLVRAAVFEAYSGVAAKRHQVPQKKPVGRFNFILVVLRLFHVGRAGFG